MESHKDTPLFLDENILAVEILKLVLHANQYPDEKFVWLGTARAVEAVQTKNAGFGTYFNPDFKYYSWALNRAYLQAAVILGYRFNLVEQHFPGITAAILADDPAQFVMELAKEIRPEMKDIEAERRIHSQYHGGRSPTATTQEILTLMDLRCRAVQNNDGSLTFHPPKCMELDLAIIKSDARTSQLKRTHSAPQLFKAQS